MPGGQSERVICRLPYITGKIGARCALGETRPTNDWQDYGTQNADGEVISSEGLSDLKQNRLLAALPADVLGRLQPALEPVELALGQVIYEPDEALSHVYFPTTAIVSLLYTMENGTSAEMGVVGCDGVVGIAVFMGGIQLLIGPWFKAPAGPSGWS